MTAVHSLPKLLARAGRRAGEAFRRDGHLRATIWVTQTADGELAEYDQPCSAPAEVDDATAIEILRTEMVADLAYDGVIAYAVAFVGWVTFTGIGCAILAKPPSVRRRVVVVEAHNDHDSVVATREIEPGPRLGPLQRHTRATPRFGGLVAARAMEAS